MFALGFTVSPGMTKLAVCWAKKYLVLLPWRYIEEIIMAIDYNIFWQHFDLLLQSNRICQQISANFHRIRFNL
jgi:hypothetical protein